jgi:hypothetical protein
MIVMLPVVCLAQAGPQQKTADLELRLQAEDPQAGVPETFSFVLVNISNQAFDRYPYE